MEIDLINNGNEKELWFIEFIFRTEIENKKYSFFISEENNYPVSINGEMAFFDEFIFKKIAVECGFIDEEESLNEYIDLSFDLEGTVDIINNYDKDLNSDVLNNINLLTDITSFLKVKMSNQSENQLFELLNFLTFDNNIGIFFKHKKRKRVKL